MKKILFGMMAAAVLATSCAKELQDVAAGDATVTFTVGTPEIATRAYSDGATATVLQYAVYDEAGELLPDLTKTDATINGSTTVELQLTTGNTYSVIFWAAAPNAPYTVDFTAKTMTVDYTAAVSNDEARDAFFKRHTFTVTGAQTETIELRRPFAQLNIGTADYAASTSAGYTPVKSTVTVKSIYSTLDLWDGAVADEAEVTYDYAEIAKNEAFPVAGYEYLAMNYLLVEAEKELVDIEFGYTETDATAAKTRTVGSVPVQRNYRTNIYGNLLTSDVDINVEIKPDYNEPAHELDALHKAALNGGEVTLTDNIELTTPLEVYGEMIINLNGKTISSPSTYAIENYGTLTIKGDGNLQGLGGIRSHGGKIIIDGGAFTCSSDWNVGTYNHIIKAENTEVVINGGNFDATVGGTTNAMINVSENSIVTINGGTFKNVNGVIPQFAPYMFTYEKNGKLIINGGDFYGGWRFNGETATTDIKGGTFAVSYDGQSFHAASTHVVTIYGGAFSLENGAKLDPAKHVATGFKAVEKDGLYYVVEGSGAIAIVSNTTELKTAIEANNTTIYMKAGIYDTKDFQFINKSLCLKGMEDGVKIYNSQSNDVACTSFDGCTITFENLTIETLGGLYKGFARMNGTYKNCTIVNNYFTCFGKHVFENCTFNAPTLTGSFTNEHCVWTYGAAEVDFVDCKFNYSDRCVNVYVDNGGNAPGITSDVEFTNCVFNTANTGSEGAVEVNSTPFTGGVNVVLNNCTAPAYGKVVYVSPWDATKGKTASIIVDGKIVAGLASALANATAGSTIVLSEDINLGDVTVGELKNVTILGGENTSMRFITDANSKIENVTIKNINFDFTTGTGQAGACVVINKDATIKDLVLDNITFVGDGNKNSYGITGQNPNASIKVKNCNFSNLGYAIQTIAGGGYQSLIVEECTFDNIISWIIMPQYGYSGDLTITGCNFKNSNGGLLKTGAFNGNTFTFTNNTITNCTGHDGADSKWFDVNASAATKVISGNTKDGAAWTPGAAEGLK